ncbi:MAG: sulfotransferase [Mariprofundaceae bacterium]|nr:sulfotransferase [Mariprofundaceae bacterium]
MQDQPIFITGSIRSGTTWLGEMLAFSKQTVSIYEPFSLNTGRFAFDELAKNWFSYAPSMPKEQAIKAFKKVINGKTELVFRRKQVQRYLPFTRHKRKIIKDPIACFSAPWLADHFNLRTVVIIRHPAAFALSLKRVGWSFDFSNLWQQTGLWRHFPEQWQLAMRKQPTDIVQQATLLWNCTYSFLLDACEQRPDWLLLRHEDLSLDPLQQFQDLYQNLDLQWDKRVEKQIIAHTSGHLSSQPKLGQVHSLKRDSAASLERWKHELTAAEITFILHETRDTAQRVYNDKDFFV